MKEALRYLNNAKETLKSVPVENGTYIDNIWQSTTENY